MFTVKELIEQLEKFPPDTRVFCGGPADIILDATGGIGTIYYVEKTEANKAWDDVVIEVEKNHPGAKLGVWL